RLTVQVYANNTRIGATTADGSGNWSFTVGGAGSNVPSLQAGSYAITVVAVDATGASSAASPALALTIDRTAPALTVSTTIMPAYIFGMPKIPVVFSGSATDSSGVAPTLTYSVKNSAGRVVASGTATVAADGTYQIMINLDIPSRKASTSQRTYTVTL